MSQDLIRETRKIPNLLLVDFGTLFAKVSVMSASGDARQMSDILILRNELYFLSEERVNYLQKESSGAINIRAGYYTYKQIEEKSLLFQVEERYVQTNAMPDNAELLTLAYKNICEQIEKSMPEIAIKIVDNYRDWGVVVAVAAFETAEARSDVERIHIAACRRLGFQAIYLNNQLLFDYFSQLNFLKQAGSEGYAIIVNIGGGDTKTAVVSGLPMPSSFRRFPIGGQYILLHIHNALREKYRVTGVVGETVENWLSEGGTVLGDAKSTIISWKRREIDIQEYLNAPEMLFDWQRYWGVERRFNSIIEIIIESLEALILQTEVDIGPILSNVIILGGAAKFRGIIERIEKELSEAFPEYKDRIRVMMGEDPQFSGINGMRNLVRLKYRDEGLLFTLLPPNDDQISAIGIDWQPVESFG